MKNAKKFIKMVEEAEPPTVTMFRKFKEGDILFLEIPASYENYYDCESYMHVGQHGAANPLKVTSETKAATPEEYADLKAELEEIGYNIKVVQRQTQQHVRNREYAYEQMRADEE